jgi:hypothetical protein
MDRSELVNNAMQELSMAPDEVKEILVPLLLSRTTELLKQIRGEPEPAPEQAKKLDLEAMALARLKKRKLK